MPVADPLSKTHPELATQWHPTRNEGLTTEDMRANSYRKVWWLCPKDPRHEWDMKIRNRALEGQGCSFCSGHRVAPGESLADLFPDIAAQWHPTSFDYIAANEDVIACDMAHVPMEDEALDVAVFSLSLMGANFTDYIRERSEERRVGKECCR